jgi:hypothetical protein
MKIALIIFGILVVSGGAAYYLFFPRDTFFTFSKPGGGGIRFGRNSVSWEAAPDHYATNGMSHLQPYIAKLLTPTNQPKTLIMFTPDGQHGFGLDALNGVVSASLFVEWQKEPQREAAVRAFFKQLQANPSRDYLAGNMRALEYPIKGTPAEVTALTRRILQELCGVSPTNALDIHYAEK